MRRMARICISMTARTWLIFAAACAEGGGGDGSYDRITSLHREPLRRRGRTVARHGSTIGASACHVLAGTNLASGKNPCGVVGGRVSEH